MRRITRFLSCAVLCVVLSACWPVPGQNADRTGHNSVERAITPATVADLELAWTTFTAGSAVVSTGGVHIVDPNFCAITTVRPSDGELVWYSILAEPDACGAVQDATTLTDPFVVDGKVVVGYDTMFNTRGCCPALWEHRFGTPAFDVATGAEGSGPLGGMVDSVRGDVSVSFHAQQVSLFSNAVIASTSVRGSGVGGPALSIPYWLQDGTTIGRDAFLHSGYGLLATAPGDPTMGYAVRAYSLSGRENTCGEAGTETCPQWATPIDGAAAGPPVLRDGGATVFAVTTAGTAYALDGATGAVQWSAPVGSAITGSPALAGGVLYVPTAAGELVAVDAATGTVRWRGATGSGAAIAGQPASAGGVVFTASTDGRVAAFDAAGCGAATCGTLWSTTAGTRMTGGPIVSNGQLYVPSNAGLTAYRLPA